MSTEQPTVEPTPVRGAAPAEIVYSSESGPTLSKSAQKRQAKAERFAQLKLERRAREREEKVLKRKEREERAATGEDVGPSESKKRRVTREGEGPVKPFNARIIIDLGFDDKMTEKEVGSLCSQLAYTYASHRRTRTPFTGLLLTSLNGRALKHMDGINDASYRRWKGVEWWTEDIDGLWNPPPTTEQPPPQETAIDEQDPTDVKLEEALELEIKDLKVPIPSSDVDLVKTEVSTPDVPFARGKPRRPRRQPDPQIRASCPRETVVYLSADAEEELLELQEGETYIIGGIVDRNRYKNLCANKARDLNVRSARLPIGRYLADMPTRKVLTVNQVFDILVNWVSTRDWEDAMQKVMPKRKFNADGKKSKNSKNPSESNDEDAEGSIDPDAEQLANDTV